MWAPSVWLVCLCALLLSSEATFAQVAPSTWTFQQEFELGLSLLAQGNYAEAATLFQQLYSRTHSERVRLEWARTAYLMQDFDQAKALFKAVLDSAPPPSVQEKILFFLDDIALAQGRVDYSTSIVRDSNPRAVPSVRSFNIFGLPFQYEPEGDTRPKWGLNYRLSYSQGLDSGRRWIASAGLLGTHFGDPAINKAGWDAHLTYRIAFAPRLEFKLSHESMDAGGSPQYRYDWLTLAYGHEPWPRWRLTHDLRYGKIDYPLYSYQNSTLSSYRVSAERMLAARASAGIELGYDQGRAGEQPYSHDGHSYGMLGAYFIDAWSTRVIVRWTQAHRAHLAVDPIFGVVRKDQRQSLNLAIDSPSFKLAGLSPVLECGYERNDSTMPLANYDRTLFSLSLRKNL